MKLHTLASFRYAWLGIKLAWREEQNVRIESLIAVFVLFAALVLRLSGVEWALLLLAICMVLVAEIVNTAFEELSDYYKKEHDPHIARIKDIAAGAVLVAVSGSVCIGIAIFVPHIAKFF